LWVLVWLFSLSGHGFLSLEEVSTGTGKVIPSSKEQVIQSLEGGILTKLNVQEGDIVQKGQILAQLDPTRFASNVGESRSLLIAAQATAARLRAEVKLHHWFSLK
jgi:adhesin transport system membrane fusion protein